MLFQSHLWGHLLLHLVKQGISRRQSAFPKYLMVGHPITCAQNGQALPARNRWKQGPDTMTATDLDARDLLIWLSSVTFDAPRGGGDNPLSWVVLNPGLLQMILVKSRTIYKGVSWAGCYSGPELLAEILETNWI